METVWAPVNCGYHATNYKYGKLYQWGRKYGQGYEGEFGDAIETVLSDGPVSRKTGESAENSNVFYVVEDSPYDWLAPQDDYLWNSGSEAVPVKTQYDPCPEGWRVPTETELHQVSRKYVHDQQGGCILYGNYRPIDGAPSLFLPYSGYRSAYKSSDCYARGDGGYYWSSHSIALNTWHYSSPYITATRRRSALSVRCVQE